MSSRVRDVFRRSGPEQELRAEISVHSVALTVVAVAAAMALLSWARAVFIPIVLSLLISFALEPVVRRLVRWRLPRMAASAVVVTLLVGALGYSGYAMSDDAASIIAEVPDAAAKLRRAVQRGQREPGAIQNVTEAAEELQRTADAAAPPTDLEVAQALVGDPTLYARALRQAQVAEAR